MGAIIAAMLIIVAIAGVVVWSTARPDEAARVWNRITMALARIADNVRATMGHGEPHPVRLRSRSRRR